MQEDMGGVVSTSIATPYYQRIQYSGGDAYNTHGATKYLQLLVLHLPPENPFCGFQCQEQSWLPVSGAKLLASILWLFYCGYAN